MDVSPLSIILFALLSSAIIAIGYFYTSLIQERIKCETQAKINVIENKSIADDNAYLKHKVFNLTNQLELAEATLNLSVKELVEAEQKLKSKTIQAMDDTTKKLIRLAVGDPDSNESRNAAVKACQRLNKQIGS